MDYSETLQHICKMLNSIGVIVSIIAFLFLILLGIVCLHLMPKKESGENEKTETPIRNQQPHVKPQEVDDQNTEKHK